MYLTILKNYQINCKLLNEKLYIIEYIFWSIEIWKHKWNLSVKYLGWNFKINIKLLQLHCGALRLFCRREVVTMSLKPIQDLAEKWPQNFVVKPMTSIHKLYAILVHNYHNSNTTQCNITNDFSNWLCEKCGDQRYCWKKSKDNRNEAL